MNDSFLIGTAAVITAFGVCFAAVLSAIGVFKQQPAIKKITDEAAELGKTTHTLVNQNFSDQKREITRLQWIIGGLGSIFALCAFVIVYAQRQSLDRTRGYKR